MKHDIRQERAYRASLWHAYTSFNEFPVFFKRGSQPTPDQAHRGFTFYLSIEQLQEQHMVYHVEELFKVNLH
jgi:hypothetical protein